MSTTLSTSPTTPPSSAASGTPRRSRSGSGLFRAFWRWHFYASVLVIPVFVMLSITGLLMLFKWQIDPLQEPALRYERPASGHMTSLSEQQAAAMQAVPGGTITAVQTPAEDRSTFFTVQTPDERKVNVYVDPYSARVLGTRDPRTLISNIATEIHGMIVYGKVSDIELFDDPVTGKPFDVGSIGDRLIELATCWALVMTLTGYYLYWRGRGARAARRAARAAGSAARSRHGLVGVIAGVGMLAMVATALPWTGLFGATFQRFAQGTPFSMRAEDPGATSTVGAAVTSAGANSLPAPWESAHAPVPTSGGHEAHAGHDHGGAAGTVIPGQMSVDQAVAVAAADGAVGPYYVRYPKGKDGVFSVLADMWHDKSTPAHSDVSQTRIVHVDQYSGRVAGRYGYDDLSPVAKGVLQGIAIHEGQRFGTLNVWLSAAFCVAVVVLCVTGPWMWWRRRRGGLSAPRGSMPIRLTPWLLAALVILGVVLPLFGMSLVVVLLFDRWVVRRSPRLSATLGAVPSTREA